MAAVERVVEEAIKYAERAMDRAVKERDDGGDRQRSWHSGRISAYEDMAGLLRMGLDAVREAQAMTDAMTEEALKT